MKNRADRTSRMMTLVMLVVIAAVFTGWMVRPAEDVRIGYRYFDNDFWNTPVIHETGKSIEGRYVSICDGERLRLDLALPDELSPDANVSFYDPGIGIRAYIDGQVIYEAGYSDLASGSGQHGASWRNIPVDRSMAGKTLEMEFYNDSGVKLLFQHNRIRIGDSGDTYIRLIHSSLTGFFMALAYLFMSVMIMVFALFIMRMGYSHYSRIVSSLGGMAFFIGVWIISDGALSQIFFDNGSIHYAVSFLSFIMVPYFSLCYFKNVLSDSERTLDICINIYKLVASADIILNYFNILPRFIAIIPICIMLGAELVIVGYSSFIHFRREGSSRRLGTLMAYIIMFAMAVSGMFEAFIGNYNLIPIYIGAGFFAMLFIMVLYELRYITMQFSSGQRVKHFNEIADVDFVTGGNSRNAAEKWLRRRIAEDVKHNLREADNKDPAETSIRMLHMNIKDFSSINALIGWEKGNEILKDIYSINEKLVDGHEFICSLGDSGFVFFLTQDEDIDRFCIDHKRLVAGYMAEKWGKLILNVQYTAISVREGDDLRRLLDGVHLANQSRLADHNKESSCRYFNEKCRSESGIRLELESALQMALKINEFKMYLQPKVDPSTGILRGAEALVRWNSRDKGLISPGTFIPILERSGMIREVDIFMFRKVCEHILYRRSKGLPELTISVNVSKYGINSPDFFDEYEKIVKELKVPGESIEFELTESMAYNDIDAIEKLVEKIHAIGAKVSVDDFGSGFSNIGIIGRLKFDIVKFDKIFFDGDFPADKYKSELAEGLIGIFHKLGIKVVCEGLEEESKVEALKDMGADMIQGYYYSRPLPEDEFHIWERARQS